MFLLLTFVVLVMWTDFVVGQYYVVQPRATLLHGGASLGPLGLIGHHGVLGPLGLAGGLGAVGPLGAVGHHGLVGPLGFAGTHGSIGPLGIAGHHNLFLRTASPEYRTTVPSADYGVFPSSDDFDMGNFMGSVPDLDRRDVVRTAPEPFEGTQVRAGVSVLYNNDDPSTGSMGHLMAYKYNPQGPTSVACVTKYVPAGEVQDMTARGAQVPLR